MGGTVRFGAVRVQRRAARPACVRAVRSLLDRLAGLEEAALTVAAR